MAKKALICGIPRQKRAYIKKMIGFSNLHPLVLLTILKA
jgi:hypothetical protein